MLKISASQFTSLTDGSVEPLEVNIVHTQFCKPRKLTRYSDVIKHNRHNAQRNIPRRVCSDSLTHTHLSSNRRPTQTSTPRHHRLLQPHSITTSHPLNPLPLPLPHRSQKRRHWPRPTRHNPTHFQPHLHRSSHRRGFRPRETRVQGRAYDSGTAVDRRGGSGKWR